MYVYIKSEPNLWIVGFYSPDGKWNSESDHETQTSAAEQVHYLNGGEEQENPYILHSAELEKVTKELIRGGK